MKNIKIIMILILNVTMTQLLFANIEIKKSDDNEPQNASFIRVLGTMEFTKTDDGNGNSYSEKRMVEGDHKINVIEKNGLMCDKKSGQPITGEAVVYYTNGNIAYMYTFINGKLDGTCITYRDDGRIEETNYYVNGKEIGIARQYNEDERFSLVGESYIDEDEKYWSNGYLVRKDNSDDESDEEYEDGEEYEGDDEGEEYDEGERYYEKEEVNKNIANYIINAKYVGLQPGNIGSTIVTVNKDGSEESYIVIPIQKDNIAFYPSGILKSVSINLDDKATQDKIAQDRAKEINVIRINGGDFGIKTKTIDYYDNGMLRQILTTKKTKINYSDGGYVNSDIPVGNFKKYYDNGQLAVETEYYTDDKYTGILSDKYYSRNGQLVWESNYDKNILTETVYFTNGNIAQEMEIKLSETKKGKVEKTITKIYNREGNLIMSNITDETSYTAKIYDKYGVFLRELNQGDINENN